MRLALPFALAALPAAAEPPSVVTDIAPVHSILSAVMGDLGAPSVLLPAGADPHGFALRPSDAAALEGADLVVLMGEALTPWIEGPLDSLAPGAVRLKLIELDGIDLIEMGEDMHGHDDDHDAHADEDHDDHDHGEHAADDHDDHDHGDTDPHAWLSPDHAARFARAAADALAELDPDNAAAYAGNAAAFGDRLAAIEAPAVEAAPWIAGHDAYAYAARWIGAPAAGAIVDADGQAPGATTLDGLQDLAAEARCVIARPGADDRLIAVLGDLPIVELDPLGADLELGADLLPALLERTAAAFAECLGG
ncbi:MAG: metal ABC transporter solute-binding protein, Zn/Mn family [Hasllibacter sp.]